MKIPLRKFSVFDYSAGCTTSGCNLLHGERDERESGCSELLKSLLQHRVKAPNSFRLHPVLAIETVFMASHIKHTFFLCGKGFSSEWII